MPFKRSRDSFARPLIPGGSGARLALQSPLVRRYHVTTFGCQMNAHDSERIKGMLEELGLGESPEQEQADVIVLNTGSVPDKPDARLAPQSAPAKALKAMGRT